MGILNYFTEDEQKSTESGGISEEFSFTADSRSAQYDKVESHGALIEEPEEELAQGPVTVETEDQGEVVQLGKFAGDEEVSNIPGDTMKLTPEEIERHSAFFTEAEKEELLKKEHHLDSEELESVEKVEEALRSPKHGNTRSAIWQELAEEEEKFGLGQEEELSQAEKDKKLTEAMQERGYDLDYEHPSNRDIQDLSGQEFVDLLQEGLNSESKEEELEENPEPEEEAESDFEPVSEELAQVASEAWQTRGGYWGDIAEDLEKESELEDTRIESLGNGFTKITTENDELQVELMSLHESESAKTQVLDLSDSGVMVAKAFEGDLDE